MAAAASSASRTMPTACQFPASRREQVNRDGHYTVAIFDHPNRSTTEFICHPRLRRLRNPARQAHRNRIMTDDSKRLIRASGEQLTRLERSAQDTLDVLARQSAAVSEGRKSIDTVPADSPQIGTSTPSTRLKVPTRKRLVRGQ